MPNFWNANDKSIKYVFLSRIAQCGQIKPQQVS